MRSIDAVGRSRRLTRRKSSPLVCRQGTGSRLGSSSASSGITWPDPCTGGASGGKLRNAVYNGQSEGHWKMKVRSLALAVVALYALPLAHGIGSAFATDFCIELTAAEFNRRAERRGDDNACAGSPRREIEPETMRIRPLHRNVWATLRPLLGSELALGSIWLPILPPIARGLTLLQYRNPAPTK